MAQNFVHSFKKLFEVLAGAVVYTGFKAVCKKEF